MYSITVSSWETKKWDTRYKGFAHIFPFARSSAGRKRMMRMGQTDVWKRRVEYYGWKGSTMKGSGSFGAFPITSALIRTSVRASNKKLNVAISKRACCHRPWREKAPRLHRKLYSPLLYLKLRDGKERSYFTPIHWLLSAKSLPSYTPVYQLHTSLLATVQQRDIAGIVHRLLYTPSSFRNFNDCHNTTIVLWKSTSNILGINS